MTECTHVAKRSPVFELSVSIHVLEGVVRLPIKLFKLFEFSIANFIQLMVKICSSRNRIAHNNIFLQNWTNSIDVFEKRQSQKLQKCHFFTISNQIYRNFSIVGNAKIYDFVIHRYKLWTFFVTYICRDEDHTCIVRGANQYFSIQTSFAEK